MPNRTRKPKDLDQLAKFVTDTSTGETPPPAPAPPREKNPAAVELGRLGGKKGGRARAERLTADERREAAQRAARARWGHPPKSPD